MTILDVQQRRLLGAQVDYCEASLAQLPAGADHAWLAALLRTAMDAVIISDGKMRMHLLNGEAQRLFGYHAPELQGRSMALLLTANSYERLQQAISGTANAVRCRAEGVRSDTSHFEMDISLSFLGCGDEAFLVSSMRERGPATAAGQRRALSFHHAHELEKRRFSHELYNELGQSLSVLKLDLDWLAQNLHADARVSLGSERISSMQSLLVDAIVRTRAIASDLRPPLLDDFGLLAAVRWIARSFEKRTGIRCEVDCQVDCEVDCNADGAASGEAVDSVVYRVVQECLLNVERHASAAHVQVSIRTDGRRLEVLVQDDGVLLPVQADRQPDSFGLVAMQERIYTLGGNMEICSSATRGSAVHVSLPIEPPVVKIS